MNTMLIALREANNLDTNYVAQKLEIEVEKYKELENGKAAMTIGYAVNLGKIYRIPAEYFFTNQSSVIHHNIGKGSNSNSGFINSYYNNEETK